MRAGGQDGVPFGPLVNVHALGVVGGGGGCGVAEPMCGEGRAGDEQVTVYGMSAAVGPLSFENSEESNTLYRPYSEKTVRVG